MAARSRSRIWKIFAGISGIALIATAITIGLLYHAAYQEQERDLRNAAETLAALMESVAQFNIKYSAGTHPEGSRGATLSQIATGMMGRVGLEGSEELVLGRMSGDRLQVLRPTRDGNIQVAQELPYDGVRGKPLFEALSGRRGSGEHIDYRGVPVLAAYAPVPSLGIGIVYKIKITALRAPFIRAGAWATAVYWAMVGLFMAGYMLLSGKLERRLESSEARFANAFHGSPVAMGIRRMRDDVVIEANDSLLELFGLQREEMLGKPVGKLALYLDEEQRAGILASAARREQIRSMEMSMRNRRDGIRNVLMSVNYLTIDGEECSMVNFIDVTQRHRAEAAQRTAERRLQNIFDSTEDRIFLLDRNGVILAHNRATAAAYGSDLNGKDVFSLGPAEVADARRMQFTRAVATGLSTHYEDVLGERHSDVIIAPIREETGAVGSVVVVSRDITKLKRGEAALRASEEQLRLSMKAAGQGFYDLDLLTGEAKVSPEYATMIGHDPATFVETNAKWAERLHPEDRAKVYATYEAYICGEIPHYEVEFRQRTSTGGWLWTLSIGSIVRRDEHGRPLRMMGTHTNIEARKKSEEALRESESRYRRAERGTNDGLWEWNILTGEDYFSPRWHQMLGYEPGDLAYHVDSFASLLHPDDKAMTWAAADRHFKSAEPFNLEIRLRCKDGSYLWVRTRGEAERDAEGKPFRMTGSITDISEAKRAAAELRHERDRLRQILDSQFGFVAELTTDGVITEVNQTPLTLMGLTRQEVLGRVFWEVGWIDPQSIPETKAFIAEAAQGMTARGDIVAFFPGVGTRYVEVVFSPLKDPAGQVASVTGFGVDITERKEVETKLLRSQMRLNEAQRIARIGNWELDLGTGRLHWSDEIFRLFEIDPAKFGATYDAFLHAIHPDDREAVNAAYTASLKDRQPYRIVHRLLMDDGRIKHVEEQCETDFAADGKPLRSRGTVQNVTEQILAQQKLEEREERLNEAQTLVHMGNWEWNVRTREHIWSDELYRIYGLRPQSMPITDEFFIEHMHPDDRPRLQGAMALALTKPQPFFLDYRIIRADGTVRHVHDEEVPVMNSAGNLTHYRGTTQDVTEQMQVRDALRASLAEKETLLREIHHRVKNNLQIIASLLHFQAKKVGDPAALTVFAEARDRLRSMIVVHEKLYSARDLSAVDFADYIRSLAGQIGQSLGSNSGGRIRLAVKTEPLTLPIETALPCGMILVELLTNVGKYAYPGGREGNATVALQTGDGRVMLSVGDDGVGLPAGFDPTAGTSFGWQMIRSLATQLDATITFGQGPGTQVTVTFPHSKPA